MTPKQTRYEIWMEGWSATGGFSKAQQLDTIEAESFAAACAKACRKKNLPNPVIEADAQIRSWGCGLFDNEEDARKAFG